jgi:nitroreductase
MTSLSSPARTAPDRAAATAVPLHPLIAGRWSPRALDAGHELGDAELLALLEAARWAPSANNRQPWRFLVGRRGDETYKAIFDTLAPGNQLWAGNAAALVVGLVPIIGPDDRPLGHPPYELGLAVGQLALQATAMGLHVHQLGGFSADAVRDRFGVPADHAAVVVLAVGALGEPDELPEALRVREAAARVRHELDAIAFAGSWGTPALSA